MPQGFSAVPVASIDVIALYFYAVEGGILMLFNFLFAGVIYSTKHLRTQKEYVIFAAIMVFDGIFGVTYFSAGVRRLIIVYGLESEYLPAYSKWDCFQVSHVLCFIAITPAVGVISFFTCLDRFISVQFPHKYLRLRATYAFGLTAATFAVSGIFLLVSGFTSYPLRNEYNGTIVCELQMSVTSSVFQSLRLTRIFTTLCGVLLYAVITKKIYYILRPKNNGKQVSYGGNRRHILRMTVTVVMITVNQLVLFILPDVVVLFSPKLSTFTFYLMNMNKGIINIFIFFFTQRELRRAIFFRLGMQGAFSVRILSDLQSTTKVMEKSLATLADDLEESAEPETTLPDDVPVDKLDGVLSGYENDFSVEL